MKPLKITQLNPWQEDEAIVTKAIEPHKRGRIRFQGTEWPARCLQNLTLPPGTTVRVVGCYRITWYVEAELGLIDKSS